MSTSHAVKVKVHHEDGYEQIVNWAVINENLKPGDTWMQGDRRYTVMPADSVTGSVTDALIQEAVLQAKKAPSEIITIRGTTYELPHPDIVKDFQTGEWLHIGMAIVGLKNLKADGSCEVVFTAMPKTSDKWPKIPEAYVLTNTAKILLGPHFGRVSFSNRLYIFDDSYTNWVEFYDIGVFLKPDEAKETTAVLRGKTGGLFHDYYELDKKGPWFINGNTFRLTGGKRYTFGVELELSSGVVPRYLREKYAMYMVRDGSLNGRTGGPEVVTGILRGDKGVYHLQQICLEISKRAILNQECGTHVHVGSMLFTKPEVICAYKLGLMLQEEMYALQPRSRYNNTYCRTLPNIDKIWALKPNMNPEEFKIAIIELHDSMFSMFSGQKANRTINKLNNHPRGARVGWDHTNMRYCWLNLVPSLFNTKDADYGRPINNPPPEIRNERALGRVPTPKKKERKLRPTNYTLEFRMHYGTVDFTAVYNWLLICMAFSNYVENYQSEILARDSVTLQQVIDTTMPNMSAYLNAYIHKQKNKMSRITDHAGEAELYVNPMHGIPTKPQTITELYKTTRPEVKLICA